MGKFFVKENQIKDDCIYITGEDVNHIKNVLRHNVGDNIIICDEQGKNYNCEIVELSKDSIKSKIISIADSNSEGTIKISIFQGVPKSDKMDLIIQKSVELGAFEFFPTEMKRCIVKFDESTINKKIDRWQKISEVASKQSGRDLIPKVNCPIKVSQIPNMIDQFDLFIVPYECEKENSLKDVLKKINHNDIINDSFKVGILIGPEGGFDEEEIKALKETNANIVTLGNRILRTETVAMSMISIIMYELGM